MWKRGTLRVLSEMSLEKIGKNRDFLRQKQKKIRYFKFGTQFGNKKE
jgi:hypothetical protein